MNWSVIVAAGLLLLPQAALAGPIFSCEGLKGFLFCSYALFAIFSPFIALALMPVFVAIVIYWYYRPGRVSTVITAWIILLLEIAALGVFIYTQVGF